jgi:hypothetical protein
MEVCNVTAVALEEKEMADKSAKFLMNLEATTYN